MRLKYNFLLLVVAALFLLGFLEKHIFLDVPAAVIAYICCYTTLLLWINLNILKG